MRNEEGGTLVIEGRRKGLTGRKRQQQGGGDVSSDKSWVVRSL